jgi:homoserine dehydrogenase
LAANQIEWLAGIINGTSNFILSEMKTKGISFAAALAQAQALGYAEADPTFDVAGIDAAHKLTLLAANAFAVPLQFDKVFVQGITALDAVDIAFAERLGYHVKLLGIAKRSQQGLELRVHPTLIAADHLLAQVNGAMNAVMVKSDAAGLTLYYGAGAGSEQTASAVIADLVDLCRNVGTPAQQRVPYLGFQQHSQAALPVLAIQDVQSAFYLRLDLENPERTVPTLMDHLADAGVRVHRFEVFDHPTDVRLNSLVLLTHPTSERVLQDLFPRLEALPTVMGLVSTLRVESLN